MNRDRVCRFTMAHFVFLSALSLGCCHYPKSKIVRQHTSSSLAAPSVTVVAYGDTRTGLFGLGDNAKEAIHSKVVKDIFASAGPIDAVVFTGDAVMSNFFLWKKRYWECFLASADLFRREGIPFYPSLGNHEVLPAFVPALRMTSAAATGFTTQPPRAGVELGHQIAVAYETGEEPTTSPELLAQAQTEQIDPKSSHGLAQLKHWEKGISKGDLASANKFGQFERQLQTEFYKNTSGDDRCLADGNTFVDDYLTIAKYEYLRPLTQGKSYYSKSLERDGIRVKLIALDTNCLDSKAQQEFFVHEVTSFEGPIIVFGHHPPVAYPPPGTPPPSSWSFDMVPGWQFFREYLSKPEGRKILLWIVGHVHNYQRWDASGNSQRPVAPVLVVAGGGGASTDQNAASFQWSPSSWPQPLVVPAYSYVKIEITKEIFSVEVRGATSASDGFRSIDSFIVLPPTMSVK